MIISQTSIIYTDKGNSGMVIPAQAGFRTLVKYSSTATPR